MAWDDFLDIAHVSFNKREPAAKPARELIIFLREIIIGRF
jgi:hypothetical protein